MSTAVRDRLAELSGRGYFADNACGEEYISGTQNGLSSPPAVISASAGASGTVAVVIERAPQRPALTATMTKQNGVWLAADLASGYGLSASIFSAKPNC
jgi:hypothetical protein